MNSYTRPVDPTAQNDPRAEPRVKRIVLPDQPGAPSARTAPLPRWIEGASWLVAPLLLLAVVGAFALMRWAPSGLFTALIALVCAIPVVWAIVSVFFPAAPDRRCPECHALSLEPITEGELRGLRCTACEFVDTSASTWKFIEEGDRPLEPIILEARPPSTLSPSNRPDTGGSS